MNYEEFEKLYRENLTPSHESEMFWEFIIGSMADNLGEPVYIKGTFELIKLASKISGKDFNYYIDSLKELGKRQKRRESK